MRNVRCTLAIVKFDQRRGITYVSEARPVGFWTVLTVLPLVVSPHVRQRCQRTARGSQGDAAAAIYDRSIHDCKSARTHYLNATECCRATAAARDGDAVPNDVT